MISSIHGAHFTIFSVFCGLSGGAFYEFGTCIVSMEHTRFTPDLELNELSPDEAFATLGNEIRLDIIRVLWRAGATYEYDDGSDAVETVSYSELQTEIEIDDNGKFNYHLSKLAPHFVRRTDDGYRLSSAGKQIARTVIAVSGAGRLDFSRELDESCPLCGAAVAVTYEDQWLRVRCTECYGLFGDQAPAGTLFLTSYPAAGLTTRDSEQALATGLYRCALDITYLMYGICRECAGQVSSSVTVCDVHEVKNGLPCDTCGTPFPVWADMKCDTCGFAKRLPVEMFATGLVLATELTGNPELDIDSPAVDEAIELLQNNVETDVSTKPLRVSLSIEVETTVFTLTLDDEMNVVEFDREPRTDTVIS
ncbi:ArsR family transcriptional regulator [Saliphagus sp. GCM10025317]